MNALGEIAKDYLAEFEILTEARKIFEQELGEWWNVIIGRKVLPALEEQLGDEPSIWENRNRPGMCDWRVAAGDPVRLRIMDPRTSDRGFYAVLVTVASQPKLKKIKKNFTLVQSMNSVAVQNGVAEPPGLNWSSRRLAARDIQILPDDPEKTGDQVRETAISFCQVLLEYARVTKG